MKPVASVCFVALALALGACSSSKAPDETEAAATPQTPQKTVFDPQFKALQKAKDMQKTIDQQKADADKKIEEGGG